MYSAFAIPADSAAQPMRSDSDNGAQPSKVPIIEAAFNNGKWWSIPANISQALYEKHLRGEEDIGYVWDWGDDRTGSWVHEDQETNLNRYVIKFDTKEQKNIDNGRLRTIRIVWVDHADLAPRWTGQIPE